MATPNKTSVKLECRWEYSQHGETGYIAYIELNGMKIWKSSVECFSKESALQLAEDHLASSLERLLKQ